MHLKFKFPRVTGAHINTAAKRLSDLVSIEHVDGACDLLRDLRKFFNDAPQRFCRGSYMEVTDDAWKILDEKPGKGPNSPAVDACRFCTVGALQVVTMRKAVALGVPGEPDTLAGLTGAFDKFMANTHQTKGAGTLWIEYDVARQALVATARTILEGTAIEKAYTEGISEEGLDTVSTEGFNDTFMDFDDLDSWYESTLYVLHRLKEA